MKRTFGVMATTRPLANGFRFSRDDLTKLVAHIKAGLREGPQPLFPDHRPDLPPVGRLLAVELEAHPDFPDDLIARVECELDEGVDMPALSIAFFGPQVHLEAGQPTITIGVAPEGLEPNALAAVGHHFRDQLNLEANVAVAEYHEHSVEVFETAVLYLAIHNPDLVATLLDSADKLARWVLDRLQNPGKLGYKAVRFTVETPRGKLEAYIPSGEMSSEAIERTLETAIGKL